MVYDFKITLWKGIKAFLIIGIPIGLSYLANWNPVIPTLTIGTLATMAVNFLKNKE